MKAITCLGALAAALSLSACAPPAPTTPVVDPYAGGAGGTATYTGKLPDGALPGSASAAYFRANVGDTVFFEKDQSALTDKARVTLARQADWLKKNGSFSSVVEGHSEETGTREYNLALGARRAGAVQEYLIAQGVPAGRVQTVSFGKERPAATCSDETCFARNRRAVTVVAPAGPVTGPVVTAPPAPGAPGV